MNPEVIKSFLVGLGFGVDDKSLTSFNKAIASATLKVTALYSASKLMAAGMVAAVAKISEGFEQMGYEYRIIAPAINKALLLRRELLKAYAAAGINITKVIQSSVKLNFSLAKTKFAFEAIYRSVASKFFDVLTKQSDLFRQKIYANMPKIQKFLERAVTATFHFIDAVSRLVGVLWGLFVRLDEATGGWSTKIIAAVAAWKLLNLAFLTTPLGLIITGLTAILALFDDFKTWQEGGESLFDWSSFVPVINSVADALKGVWGVLNEISESVANVVLALYQLFTGDFSGAWQSLADSGQAIINTFLRLWDVIKGVGGALSALGNWAVFNWGNANSAANAASALDIGRGAAGSPVSGNTQNNSLTNQHVQQQTNINVIGSADANAVGKAVAGEQSRVNFDLTRNMKGATR
jgi:hypothetical protein